MDPISSPVRDTLVSRHRTEDDWSALVAWRNGDERAARRLARRYFAQLMRFFLNKTRDVEDATDLVSETFLGCSASRARAHRRGSFRSYLFAVAMNKLRGYHRMQATRRHELDDLADLCVATSLSRSPTSLIAHAPETRLLVTALRHLTLAEQIVLEFEFFEGLRGPQIAALLGLPNSTIQTHLSGGHQRLLQLLEQLAADPKLAESTLSDLDTWAEQVRQKIPRS